MFAPYPIQQAPYARRHGLLATVLVVVAGCSPAAPPPETDTSWGGASFVVWPPPASASQDDVDNPWLTGEALEGVISPSVGSGGGPAAPDDDPVEGVGGSSPVNAPGVSASGGTTSEPAPVVPAARLLLRAYVESSGSFKAVLVEHLGGAPSGDCTVELYSNGSTDVWRRLDVPVGLAPGGRALLCVPEAAVSACTVGFGGSVFNGNDALVLRCDGEVQDSLGTVGTDPGKGWTGTGYDGNPISTVDRGLWRCDDERRLSFAFDQWMDWDWAADPAWSGPSCVGGGLGGAANAP